MAACTVHQYTKQYAAYLNRPRCATTIATHCAQLRHVSRPTWAACMHVRLQAGPQQLCRVRSRTRTSAAAAAGASWSGDDARSNSSSHSSSTAGASEAQTVFNLVNVIMGAGYVTIPFALKLGGWSSLALLWVLGAVFCYTGMVVLQCCRHIEKQRPSSSSSSSSSSAGKPRALAPFTARYEDAAAAAFGPIGQRVVAAFMYAELLGICCVYIVLEAETLGVLFGNTAVGQALVSTWGPQTFGLMAAALVLPTVLLPDLSALSALGALGVVAAIAVGLALAMLLLTGAVPPVVGPRPLLVAATMPSVLGMLAFVFAGHSTFPVIQQSMAQPKKGPRAVKLGYFCTALISTLAGAFGYALYGPATTPSITACLPAAAAVTLVCTALTAANPFSAFALTLEPVALAAQKLLPPSSADSSSEVPYPVRAAVRLGIAVACAAVGISLPFVAELMSFVGALITTSISLMIPALMHLIIMRDVLSPLAKVLDAGVLLLGATCAVVGASSACKSIQEKLAATAVAAATGSI